MIRLFALGVVACEDTGNGEDKMLCLFCGIDELFEVVVPTNARN